MDIISRTVKGRDGHTVQRACQRKAYPRAIPAAWREKILWLEATNKKIFMCIKDGSEELICVTPLFCLVSRAVNRRPREDAACQMMRSYAEAREPKLEIDVRLVNTYLSLPMSAEPPNRVVFTSAILAFNSMERVLMGCLCRYHNDATTKTCSIR